MIGATLYFVIFASSILYSILIFFGGGIVCGMDNFVVLTCNEVLYIPMPYRLLDLEKSSAGLSHLPPVNELQAFRSLIALDPRLSCCEKSFRQAATPPSSSNENFTLIAFTACSMICEWERVWWVTLFPPFTDHLICSKTNQTFLKGGGGGGSSLGVFFFTAA